MMTFFRCRNTPCVIPAIGLLFLTGCSSASKAPEKDEAAASKPTKAEVSEIQSAQLSAALTTLANKVTELEQKLSSMNDKLDITRSGVESLQNFQKTKATEVTAHPSEATGVELAEKPVKNDPESGFVNDAATQGFRKAMILFDSQKYPEAVLAFSAFIERYADHPLAGSAQFYVGESYFKQKEYKLAIQEYQHVLTSYDRSSHVADTLARMAESEEMIKQSENAAKHRQLLTSLFPQSPAASVAFKSNPVKTAIDGEPVPQEREEKESTAETSEKSPLDQPPATAPIPTVTIHSEPKAKVQAQSGTPATDEMKEPEKNKEEEEE
jgi:TolA-binding protein